MIDETKLEIELIESEGLNYIVYESNGMKCKIHLSHIANPFTLCRVAEELKSFYKIFFSIPDGESWVSCMSDSDIENTFGNFTYLEEYSNRPKNYRE